MGILGDYLDDHFPTRNPPYRPLATIEDAEAERLTERLGAPENYATDLLQQMVLASPEDAEYKRALVSAIVSAEYAGIDAFGRNVARWEDHDELPEELIHAMIRQTYDEVRHARLGTELLEAYDGVVGDYPDTLAGMSQAQQDASQEAQAQRVMNLPPVATLSMVNVSIEGQGLRLFNGVSNLGRKIGDDLMAHAYDYNWADEVTHVAIGDWFIRKMSEDNPVNEVIAMKAHAMAEAQRPAARRVLADSVKQEIVAFMQGETERASSVLVGPLSDVPVHAVSGGYEPGA